MLIALIRLDQQYLWAYMHAQASASQTCQSSTGRCENHLCKAASLRRKLLLIGLPSPATKVTAVGGCAAGALSCGVATVPAGGRTGQRLVSQDGVLAGDSGGVFCPLPLPMPQQRCSAGRRKGRRYAGSCLVSVPT